jgi:hypothetical protein
VGTTTDRDTDLEPCGYIPLCDVEMQVNVCISATSGEVVEKAVPDKNEQSDSIIQNFSCRK